METREYFKKLENEVKKVYEIANTAKKMGYDPKGYVETPLALSMAEKVVNLIGIIHPQIINSGIIERILELEKIYGKLNITIVFKIAEEVARQKFCKFSSELEAMDAGVRIGFAYITLGVVSSPIEGFTGLKVRKSFNGENYIEASFSGPIRSAGTTAACVALILIDFLRESFGYSKYDPTKEEISRAVLEVNVFHERIANLQYLPTEEEIIFLLKNIPIQIAGDPSEKLEVSNYKNLARVDTNNLRSGVCLILSEGLAQKAAKGFRLLGMAKENGVVANGFNFLSDYIELHKKRDDNKEKDKDPVYIKDLVAGRPVFSHPSRSGGFRFRYGRGRVSGFSAASVHPATMAITDNFIATGTQLKIEKPTKGCVVTPCDVIDGPIVKLNNGSIKKIKTKEDGERLYKDIAEIIYIGDILFPFSDVLNRNSDLIKPGFVEEWWNLLLGGKKVEDEFNVSLDEAINLSKRYRVPLHPKYIFYWTEINKNQFCNFLSLLKKGVLEKDLTLDYNSSFGDGKRALELLGVEFDVNNNNNIVIDLDIAKSLFLNLGIVNLDSLNVEKYNMSGSVLEIINKFSEFEIKNKAGSFIGARMGRPEKAKLRKQPGSPNVLFPVGKFGGRLKNIVDAAKIGKIRGVFHNYFCNSCLIDEIFPFCSLCNKKTEEMFYCYDCDKKYVEPCKIHNKGAVFSNKEVDMSFYFDNSCKRLGINKNSLQSIRGVNYMTSSSKIPENLMKGILRAKYDLEVNKDGTIRMDATELPLISFKPKEIETTVEKLIELGYKKDIYGEDLVSEEQIIEIMPHDVLISDSIYSPDKMGGDVFGRICNFVDDELKLLYGMSTIHNIKKRSDLIGQLGVCMAPHNCAGVICRFIGFNKTLGLLASPYMHAAIRRDCDGDEAAIMLLSDVLLNFSKEYLPSHRGGTQDAPLVLNAKIDPGEVDDQILDFEILGNKGYPLELYELAEKEEHSSKVNIKVVRDIISENGNLFSGYGFSHDTNNFNSGVNCSSYKIFPTMNEKVSHQMLLADKLRAVDANDVARLVIERHLLGDIRGNFRKFFIQNFRCLECNSIIRRPPLSGACNKCGGKLIFTVNEGGIKKYLNLAISLASSYEVSTYLRETLELTKEYIDSVFGEDLAES